MLILKIIFKNKKYYLNIFLNKNTLKNNYYYEISHNDQREYKMQGLG